jgi:RNA polymerase sigma factor (sigma-70 family)
MDQTVTASSPDPARLAESCIPLAYKLVRPFLQAQPGRRDDYLSAAYWGLVKAARDFDPALGVPFFSYAAIRIRGALIDCFREVTHTVHSLDEWAELPVEPDPPAAETLLDFERLIRCVPERHREILRLIYRDGLSHREVGLTLGLAPSRVGHLVHDAFTILAWWHRLPSRSRKDPDGHET